MTLPVLRTPRLVLRPLGAQDAAFITTAMQDRAVWKWLSVIPQPYTHAHAMEFIDGRVGRGANWLVEMDGVPQGVIGLDNELGYWLAREAWGQGVITEAGDAVIDWAFADPARSEILSGHFDDNARSARALGKLGFVDAGPKLLGCLSDGRTEIPSRHMRLTRTRWEDRRRFRVTTDRLTLREMTAEDAPDLARIGGHPVVAPNLFAMTVGWSENAAARMIDASRFRGRIPFRAAICKDGEMIGTCGVGGIGQRALPSIMYALDPAHAGHGYTTEAMLGFVDALDRRFAPGLLEADHFTDNPASGAVLRKLGFRETGQGMGTSRAREGAHPVALFQRPALHTDRLMLRPLRPADGADLHAIVSFWDVARQLGSWPWPPDPGVSQSRSVPYDGTGDVWAIVENGHLIGTIGVNEGANGQPGIGYMLSPAAHGRGIMTEAARAAITHAFATYDWPVLLADTWADNDASHGLLLKLGFTQTGTMRIYAKARGRDTDGRSYRLAREDWRPSP